MSRKTVKATDMIHTHVVNWENENLGIIEEVMINKLHGEIAYLVLSYPGEYGRNWPNKRFAVPYDAIARKVMPDGHEVEYILNVDEDFLRFAPGFNNDQWPDFASDAFASVVKEYYQYVSVDLRV